MAKADEKVDEKPREEVQAPEKGAFFMHLDDFLNALQREAHGIESINAFAYLQKRLGVIKRTEEAWRDDFEKFLKDYPK
jgi:hypothetical protein